MKVYVAFQPVDTAFGGGNQFLKALIKWFDKNNFLAPSFLDADVVLFNSHHQIEKLDEMKKLKPSLKFCHRVDGPIQLVRGINDGTDEFLFKLNTNIADGTIFQSNWSYKQTKLLSLNFKSPFKIIKNSSDPDIFFPYINKVKNNKIKLIASSWSNNIKKGFDWYKLLDERLDFTKYEMMFVGRSPIVFKNIKHIEPLNSIDLSNLLRTCDIMINCSKDDPCSNSLIEGILCGLGIVYLKSGGHDEIVGNNGESFFNFEELLNKIDIVSFDLKKYILNKRNIDDFSKTAQDYLDFIKII